MEIAREKITSSGALAGDMTLQREAPRAGPHLCRRRRPAWPLVTAVSAWCLRDDLEGYSAATSRGRDKTAEQKFAAAWREVSCRSTSRSSEYCWRYWPVPSGLDFRDIFGVPSAITRRRRRPPRGRVAISRRLDDVRGCARSTPPGAVVGRRCTREAGIDVVEGARCGLAGM